MSIGAARVENGDHVCCRRRSDPVDAAAGNDCCCCGLVPNADVNLVPLCSSISISIGLSALVLPFTLTPGLAARIVLGKTRSGITVCGGGWEAPAVSMLTRRLAVRWRSFCRCTLRFARGGVDPSEKLPGLSSSSPAAAAALGILFPKATDERGCWAVNSDANTLACSICCWWWWVVVVASSGSTSTMGLGVGENENENGVGVGVGDGDCGDAAEEDDNADRLALRAEAFEAVANGDASPNPWRFRGVKAKSRPGGSASSARRVDARGMRSILRRL